MLLTVGSTTSHWIWRRRAISPCSPGEERGTERDEWGLLWRPKGLNSSLFGLAVTGDEDLYTQTLQCTGSWDVTTQILVLILIQSNSLFSYIRAREVPGGWVIQGNPQQLFPEDRDEVLGHDLLLLLGAVVFQWQDHRVGRHLSRKNHI